MAKIKDFKDYLNEQSEEDLKKEWLPSDFDFRQYVDDNLPTLAKRVLVPNQIDHVAHLLERLAKAYSGEKEDDDFLEFMIQEKYDKALMTADDVNKIAFCVYVVFQINKVPLMLREKNKVVN